MTFKKSMISIAAAGVIAAGLTGCGSSDSTTAGTGGTGTAVIQVQDDAISGSTVVSNCGTATALATPGFYEFTACAEDNVFGAVTATGGYIDLNEDGKKTATDRDLGSNFVMKSPANTAAVTPFTTLIQDLIDGGEDNITVAKQTVADKLGMDITDVVKPVTELTAAQQKSAAKLGNLFAYAAKQGNTATLLAKIKAQTTVTSADALVDDMLTNQADLFGEDNNTAANLKTVFADTAMTTAQIQAAIQTAETKNILNLDESYFSLDTIKADESFTSATDINTSGSLLVDNNGTIAGLPVDGFMGEEINASASTVEYTFAIAKSADYNATDKTATLLVNYERAGAEDNSSIMFTLAGMEFDGNTSISSNLDTNFTIASSGNTTIEYTMKDNDGATVEANSSITQLSDLDLNTSVFDASGYITVQIKTILDALKANTADSSDVTDFNATGDIDLAIALKTGDTLRDKDYNTTLDALTLDTSYYVLDSGTLEIGTTTQANTAPTTTATANVVSANGDLNTSAQNIMLQAGNGSVDRNITLAADDENSTNVYKYSAVFLNDANSSFITKGTMPAVNTTAANLTVAIDTNDTTTEGFHPSATLSFVAVDDYGVEGNTSDFNVSLNRAPTLLENNTSKEFAYTDSNTSGDAINLATLKLVDLDGQSDVNGTSGNGSIIITGTNIASTADMNVTSMPTWLFIDFNASDDAGDLNISFNQTGNIDGNFTLDVNSTDVNWSTSSDLNITLDINITDGFGGMVDVEDNISITLTK